MQRVLLYNDETAAPILARKCREKGLHVDLFSNALDAAFHIQDNEPYAVIICDLLLPDMDGIRFLSMVDEMSPGTVKLIMTDAPYVNGLLRAVNEANVFGICCKSWGAEGMCRHLERALRHYRGPEPEVEPEAEMPAPLVTREEFSFLTQ